MTSNPSNLLNPSSHLSPSLSERKFKEGDIVLERIHPNRKMIITGFSGNMNYCKSQEFPHRKELVYFDRDLITEEELASRR